MVHSPPRLTLVAIVALPALLYAGRYWGERAAGVVLAAGCLLPAVARMVIAGRPRCSRGGRSRCSRSRWPAAAFDGMSPHFCASRSSCGVSRSPSARRSSCFASSTCWRHGSGILSPVHRFERRRTRSGSLASRARTCSVSSGWTGCGGTSRGTTGSSGSCARSSCRRWWRRSFALRIACVQGFVDLHFLWVGRWPSLGRASGTLLDANASGVLYALWIALPVGFAVAAVRRRSAVLLCPRSILLLAATWATASRTGLFVAVAGLAGLVTWRPHVLPFAGRQYSRSLDCSCWGPQPLSSRGRRRSSLRSRAHGCSCPISRCARSSRRRGSCGCATGTALEASP